MLTKVEVRTALGLLLVLTLEDASNGFVVEEIGGLDPGKATVVSSSFAQVDGAQYQSSRRETRNITMRLRLEPDYISQTVRDLRKTLYSFFMPKTALSLRFFDSDGLTVEIAGRAESLESLLFNQQPLADISILCFDPDFLELEDVFYTANTVDDDEEFLIQYDGSVETGLEFILSVDRILTEFTIYHRGPDDTMRSLDFAAALEADDELTINTNVGSKVVTLLRDSTLSSVLYGMTPQSAWIELLPGDNHIRVYAVGAPIPFTITFRPRHGGL